MRHARLAKRKFRARDQRRRFDPANVVDARGTASSTVLQFHGGFSQNLVAFLLCHPATCWISAILFFLDPRAGSIFLPRRLYNYAMRAAFIPFLPLRRPRAASRPANRGNAICNAAASTTTTSESAITEVCEELLSQNSISTSDLPLFRTLTSLRASLFARVLHARTRHLTFVLDGVHGGHNIAAVARTCDAWGVQDLHLLHQRERDEISFVQRLEKERSVRNVSKGAHKWLSIHEHSHARGCVEQLKRDGYKVMVSSLSADACDIRDVDIETPVAFVFGNERDGITQDMISSADGLFTIPMVGYVESMNVSVAVATTAALMISKARAVIPPEKFMISAEERRVIASEWLSVRFGGGRKVVQPLPSKEDVTKLGVVMERKIVADGMFVRLEEWGDAFAMGEHGGRVVSYVSRRKFGVMNDNSFARRKDSAVFTLSGVHALTTQACLYDPTLKAPRYQAARMGRQRYVRFFERICDAVNDVYQPWFDQFGIPVVPGHLEEGERVFEACRHATGEIVKQGCLKFVEEGMDVDRAYVSGVVERASFGDVAMCVAQCLRLDQSLTEILLNNLNKSLGRMEELQDLLCSREPEHRFLPPNLSSEDKTVRVNLSNDERDLLQVLLRMSHCAYLTSELHQIVWCRETIGGHREKIRSLRMGILESLLRDAYAEMTVVYEDSELALLRAVYEWDQTLASLKAAFAKPEERG